MRFQDLPQHVREAVVCTQFKWKSIKYEFEDALKKADNYDEFKEIFEKKMRNLISNAREAINDICRRTNRPC